ncbi:MAG: uroporphyrinogen-III synthase [Pseudomonadota bacterium]
MPEPRAALITRPLEDSRREADALEAAGIPSEIWPLTAIRPVATRCWVPPTVDGLLLTSGHGARAFAALSDRRDLPALCVGARTAEIARGLGFAAMPGGGDAAALARFAIGSGLRHFFHPRGRDTAADLPALLKPSGQHVTEAVLYAAEETGPPPSPVAHALASGRIGAVGLWTARNATHFARHLTTLNAAPGLVAVAISEAAARPLADSALTLRIADMPTGPAMRAALVETLGAPT